MQSKILLVLNALGSLPHLITSQFQVKYIDYNNNTNTQPVILSYSTTKLATQFPEAYSTYQKDPHNCQSNNENFILFSTSTTVQGENCPYFFQNGIETQVAKLCEGALIEGEDFSYCNKYLPVETVSGTGLSSDRLSGCSMVATDSNEIFNSSTLINPRLATRICGGLYVNNNSYSLCSSPQFSYDHEMIGCNANQVINSGCGNEGNNTVLAGDICPTGSLYCNGILGFDDNNYMTSCTAPTTTVNTPCTQQNNGTIPLYSLCGPNFPNIAAPNFIYIEQYDGTKIPVNIENSTNLYYDYLNNETSFYSNLCNTSVFTNDYGYNICNIEQDSSTTINQLLLNVYTSVAGLFTGNTEIANYTYPTACTDTFIPGHALGEGGCLPNQVCFANPKIINGLKGGCTVSGIAEFPYNTPLCSPVGGWNIFSMASNCPPSQPFCASPITRKNKNGFIECIQGYMSLNSQLSIDYNAITRMVGPMEVLKAIYGDFDKYNVHFSNIQNLLKTAARFSGVNIAELSYNSNDLLDIVSGLWTAGCDANSEKTDSACLGIGGCEGISRQLVIGEFTIDGCFPLGIMTNNINGCGKSNKTFVFPGGMCPAGESCQGIILTKSFDGIAGKKRTSIFLPYCEEVPKTIMELQNIGISIFAFTLVWMICNLLLSKVSPCYLLGIRQIIQLFHEESRTKLIEEVNKQITQSENMENEPVGIDLAWDEVQKKLIGRMTAGKLVAQSVVELLTHGTDLVLFSLIVSMFVKGGEGYRQNPETFLYTKSKHQDSIISISPVVLTLLGSSAILMAWVAITDAVLYTIGSISPRLQESLRINSSLYFDFFCCRNAGNMKVAVALLLVIMEGIFAFDFSPSLN